MPRFVMPAVLVATAAAVISLPTLAAAGPPVVKEHVHFTSEPFDDAWCGIEGTSVDDVVASFSQDPSGAGLERVNLKTLFTATASGKSMEIHQTGSRRSSAPIDNGDGTYSVLLTNSGLSPKFKLLNGPVIVIDVGLVEFRLTFDSSTDDFISFEVLREKGQRPPGCATIVKALS